MTATNEQEKRNAGHVGPPDDLAHHLLVVDDDRRIRTLLSRYLTARGYRVTTAESAAQARRRLAGLSFDLIVLDVMMPGESGLELAADLRRRSDVAILMLTARSEPENRIEGLELGVDDYLAKPFEPLELVLRISNILKRRAAEEAESDEVAFGPYLFHPSRGELTCRGAPVRLTEREREILRLFTSTPGQTVERAELAGGANGSERAVDVQINRLRRKIERDPTNPTYLQTVRGIGYRLQLG